jgi:hypothetical protein
MRPSRRNLLAATLASVFVPGGVCAGREVAGVALPDEARLSAEGAALPLTGAGVFRYFFLSVYVCGLYLPPRVTWRGEPLRADASRRVALVMLRNVSARLFVWGLDKGLADNTPAGELAALGGPVEKLRAAIRGLDSLKEGARVNVDYLPETGTRVYLGERAVSEPIQGKAFNDALLRVWVGQRPLDAGLKEVLLGA